MESNWLLILTIVILAVAVLLGYMRGLIRTVLNLVIGVLTLVLVLIFSPRVCDFLQNDTGLPSYVETKVEAVVWQSIDGQTGGAADAPLDAAGQEAVIDQLPFVAAVKDELLERGQEYLAAGTEAFASFITTELSEKIVVLIGYILTFIVVFFVLRIAVFLLRILEHLPIIHGLNKIGGLAAGLIEGLLLVWILGIVLTVLGTTQIGQSAAQCVASSEILTVIYGNNLLLEIIF